MRLKNREKTGFCYVGFTVAFLQKHGFPFSARLKTAIQEELSGGKTTEKTNLKADSRFHSHSPIFAALKKFVNRY